MAGVDDLFAETPATHQAMNNLIRDQVESGYRPMSDLTGPDGRQAPDTRCAAALDELEYQQRRGDTDGIAYAEHCLDEAIKESRAARGQPRDEQGQFASFDGGVRGRKAYGRAETASDHFLQGMLQSVAERSVGGTSPWGQSVQDKLTRNT